jgi:hypothetical protein
MTVNDYYTEACTEGHYSLKLLIEFLVYEKKVITFSDDEEKLQHYLQPKFSNKMNEYLKEYEDKQRGQVS